MSAPDTSLQRRYRRLLVSYPRQFRAQHGEELLAVMLEGARKGQRFPTAREAVDLLGHGLRARIWSRNVDTAVVTAVRDRDVSWGNALAAASVHGLGPAPVGSWTIPRWLKWLAVTGAVVMAAAIGAKYVFLDSPTKLAGYSGSGSVIGSVGQATYHGLPVRPAGDRATATTVNLRSVTPRIAINTAGAEVTVLVCTGDSALVYGGTWQGAVAVRCARYSGFKPGTIRLGTPVIATTTTGVLVAVKPHHAGIVRIQGANVTYQQGDRQRHQHVGMNWTLRVP